MRINTFWVCSVEYKWIQIKKTRQVNGIEKSEGVGTENWDLFINKKRILLSANKKM